MCTFESSSHKLFCAKSTLLSTVGSSHRPVPTVSTFLCSGPGRRASGGERAPQPLCRALPPSASESRLTGPLSALLRGGPVRSPRAPVTPCTAVPVSSVERCVLVAAGSLPQASCRRTLGVLSSCLACVCCSSSHPAFPQLPREGRRLLALRGLQLPRAPLVLCFGLT